MLEILSPTECRAHTGAPLESPTVAEVEGLAQFLFSITRRRAQMRPGRLVDEDWDVQMAYRATALAALDHVVGQAVDQ
jgi:hypothetical protein